MDAREERDETPVGRWLATLRVTAEGPGAPPAMGSSRRLGRGLTAEELAALHEELREVAEAFLAEIGAIEDDGEGWAELLRDGSWAWRIPERGEA